MAYRFNWADTQQIVETADERLIERIARFLCLAAEPCGEPADIRVSGGEGAWTLDTPYGAGAASEPRDLAYLLLESLAYGFQETTRTPLAHVGAIDAGQRAALLFEEGVSSVSSSLLYRNGFRPLRGSLRRRRLQRARGWRLPSRIRWAPRCPAYM